MYIDQSFMKIFSILTFLYPTAKGQNCNNLSCSGETCTVKFNPVVVPTKVPQTKLPTKYDSKGLQPFFNLANSFMNTVQSKRFDEHFKDFDTSDLSKSKNEEMIKEYEIPIGVAAGFGLLFALLMPIIGCCFCCCRCCGKCGGMMSQQPKQARQHKCCCAMGVLLLLVTIFMLCGVLFMFVTNNRLHGTYDEIGPTYEEVINEVIKYGNAVQEELQSIPKTQVTCISNLVEYDLGDDMVKVLVGNELKNLVSQNLTDIITLGKAESENITKIGGSLQGVNDTSNTLKLLATELNNTINSINSKIKQAEADCNASTLRLSSLCDEIGSNLVTTNIDYNQFPNVDDEFASVDGVIKKNLTAQIQEAENILNNIPTTVADKSKDQRQGINKTIDKMKETIRNSINNITADIDRETNGRREEYMKYKKDYLDDKSKYENYRFYVYIALSSVMALIVLLMGCGLTLGTIGYRRDRSPTQRRSISNHGGNCLMAAVGFMFLFSFFFMIFCVVWFIAGIHMHIVCRDSKDAQPIDVFLASELSDSKVDISQSLNNCRENQPLYTAINGENIYNISAEFDVEKQAEGFREDARNININLDNVLTADAEQALTDIQRAGVDSINYTQFFNTLRTKITETNLTKLADDLARYSKVANDSRELGLVTSLNAIITDLENLQRNTTAYISTNLTKLDGEVKTLQKMADHIVPQAQKILNGLNASNEELKSEISQIIAKYADRMIGWLNQGTAHLINQARTNMARCKPLANIYDGAVNTFLCDNVVQNANGFWLALGWCLLFFIPAIILCVRLAKYFRRMDYEVGHEEIIDHPPFNDKIPLQNVGAGRHVYSNHPPYMNRSRQYPPSQRWWRRRSKSKYDDIEMPAS